MPNTFLLIKLPAWSIREKKEREIKRVSQKNVREREREKERERETKKERKKERERCREKAVSERNGGTTNRKRIAMKGVESARH